MLNQVTTRLARWRKQSWGRSLTVSVNLSARQLRQPELVPGLMAMLLATGMDPEALCLELTETTFMEDAGSHRDTLADIRSLGLGLAIDDFGTGYSSLTYVKRFPVTVVKVDRARAERAAAGEPDDEVHRPDPEFVLQLDMWLRDYRVRLDLTQPGNFLAMSGISGAEFHKFPTNISGKFLLKARSRALETLEGD